MVEEGTEDTELIRGILHAGDLAFKLMRVQTREEFEQALEEQRPDLIVSEHGSRELDSVAALNIARAMRPDVPFIFITGSDEDPLALEALQRGADGFVSKQHPTHWLPKFKRSLRLAQREAQHLRLERTLREKEQQSEQSKADLEERVARKTRELQAATKELEAFSYSVSHDLRAPLRHINSFIYLLEQSLQPHLNDESRQRLRIVAEAAEHLGHLVDDLLSLSRVGRKELRKIPVNVTALVNEARGHLREEMHGRDIDWVIAPLPVIEADPVALRQVFTNLLSNALKYSSPRPQARIEVGSTETDDEVIFFVRDNGVGFDMEQSSKLFGVFQRLHDEREFEGTGIGLAIVRRVIQRHGGRVWAESAVDHGATFYFALPKPPETETSPLAKFDRAAPLPDEVGKRL
jgi:signal transduction histidine kinase